MDAEKFGTFIAAVRKEKNMTQAQLAEKIHVTDKAVSRWERGVGFPDINMIEPLADALEISVLEIMKWEKIMKTEISNKVVSEAMADIFQLAEKQRIDDRRNTMLAGVCIVLALITVIFIGKNAWFEVLIFYTAVLAAAISWCYYHEAKDEESRKIYRGFLLGAAVFILSVGNIFFRLREFSLLMDVFWEVVLLWICISRIRKREKKRKWKEVFLMAAFLVVLVWNTNGIVNEIRQMYSQTANEQAVMVKLYAKTLLLENEDVTSVTGEYVTYGAPDGEKPESYYVAFNYLTLGDDTEKVYGYQITVDDEMNFDVLEQGKQVGEELVNTAEE